MISHMRTVNETNGMMNVIHTVKCIQLKQLKTKTKRANLNKLRLDRDSNPDAVLQGNRMQVALPNGAYEANWRPGHCELEDHGL